MLEILMTKEMIVEEMKQVACEERAVEFAIGRLDFDKLIDELSKLDELYKTMRKVNEQKHVDSPEKLAKLLHWLDYLFVSSALEVRHKFYSNAFFFDSEVLIDYDQWYDGTYDEMEEEFESLFCKIEENDK